MYIYIDINSYNFFASDIGNEKFSHKWNFDPFLKYRSRFLKSVWKKIAFLTSSFYICCIKCIKEPE